MAATGYTPIQLYYSTTAATAPTAGNLVAGELALNTLDEKLYFKNSAGVVKLLASNAGSTGSVSSVAATVPSFLSIAGSPITTSGTLAISLSGTALPTTSGGTGLTSFTSGGVVYASSSSALATGSALTFDGTTPTSSNATGSPNFIFNSNANTPYIRFDQTGASKFTIGESSIVGGGGAGFYDFYATAGIGLRFFTNASERGRFSTAGGFSVGTTSDPGAGAIYATGNITAFFSSDIKFKENVRDIPDALAAVNAIGGKLFDWTDEYIEDHGGADGYFVQKADFGVIAQDVQKVFPIAVRTREDGSLAVDYEKLGALAFAALVELTKRVEALEVK
jgi:hypothetical protein